MFLTILVNKSEVTEADWYVGYVRHGNRWMLC